MRNVETITPYHSLNKTLGHLLCGMRGVLSDNLVGLYLQGSFAVGDFDLHSDVDFIAVVGDELHPAEIQELQILHRSIFKIASPWAQHLEGSYFPITVLADQDCCGSPLWYLDNGADKLVRSEHCNTLLVRWILRERGIKIYGPPAKSLIGPIPVRALREEILRVMHTWGEKILADPDRYANRFYQGFIVLSYCRMLHDYLAGRPGSKKEGAEWAKENLDPRWTGLIDRTWDTRPRPEEQICLTPDPGDFSSTLEFVRYILKESEKYRF